MYAPTPAATTLEHDGLVSYSQARPGIYDSFQPAATVLYHELAHDLATTAERDQPADATCSTYVFKVLRSPDAQRS